MLAGMISGGPAQRAALQEKAYYERALRVTRARLDRAVTQLNATNGAVNQLVLATEKRHAALNLLLTQVKSEPGLAVALAPQPIKVSFVQSPLGAVQAVRDDQDRMVTAAETYAKSRADRLRMALRLAGLGSSTLSRMGARGVGGPLIDAKDPSALAAELDVDRGFAERIQHTASDLSAIRGLSAAAEQLPLARPTDNTEETSGFGERTDPFTGRPAFHPGQDFAGAMATPIHSTGPGVISFTGVRSGYGNTVEIDHGHGFKTRYAHLSAICVTVGQRVALGQRIGAMGSTGRSTGPHLHYEVWVDGRVQNPKRFLEAGAYVQQTG
jgi:murein DD-endopeptidase MepM/ murein hydrolase activator NlpD